MGMSHIVRKGMKWRFQKRFLLLDLFPYSELRMLQLSLHQRYPVIACQEAEMRVKVVTAMFGCNVRTICHHWRRFEDKGGSLTSGDPEDPGSQM
jgi:hypothetical protein